jgi:hypothetical protein
VNDQSSNGPQLAGNVDNDGLAFPASDLSDEAAADPESCSQG